MNNGMSKEKNNILIILYFLACIAFYFISRFIGKNVSAWVIFILISLLENLYVIPTFVKQTRILFGYDYSFTIFIPVINEMQIFPPLGAILTCLLSVLFMLGVGAMFINVDILVKFMPYKFAASWADNCIYFSRDILVLLCIIRAVCYRAVIKDINARNRELFNIHTKDKWSFVRMLGNISLLIPGIRTLGLLLQLPTLNKLTVLHRDVLEGILEEEYEEYNQYEEY